MTEEESFSIEAALYCGATPDDDLTKYTFTEAQLLDFARRLQGEKPSVGWLQVWLDDADEQMTMNLARRLAETMLKSPNVRITKRKP